MRSRWKQMGLEADMWIPAKSPVVGVGKEVV